MAQAPRQQAAQAAQAAVPTAKSIKNQYGQSIQDASGFTQALMQLLQQGGGASVAGGYAPAIAQQGAIGQAAAQRLATITGGSPIGNSSAAAVGGLADSAMSHLVANQAAARSYAGQLPAAAAARGILADKSLIDARNQALQARQQQYSQAYQSALGQARQQAEAMREFGINAQMQRQQMAQQNSQFQQSLAQRNAQFSASQAQQFKEFQMNLGAQIKNQSGRAGSALSNFTPSEISQLQKRAFQYVDGTATLHGLPIQVTIRNLQAQGIPLPIAIAEAQNSYQSMTPPDRYTQFGWGTAKQNTVGYQQALKAYHTALGSFRKWVKQRQWNAMMGGSKGYQGTYRPVGG